MSTTAGNAIGSLVRGGGALCSGHAVAVSDLEQATVEVAERTPPRRRGRKVDKGLLAASLVVAISTAMGPAGWEAYGLNVLLMGALPILFTPSWMSPVSAAGY